MSSDGGVWVKIDGGGEPDAGGLVLVNATTFSAVSSVSIDDVFSATYDNYAIIGYLSTSTSVDITYRLRTSGSDNTASNYQRQLIQASSTSVSGLRQPNVTLGTLVYSSTAQSAFNTLITQPFLSGVTTFNTSSIQQLGASLNYVSEVGGFVGSQSFDGMSIFVASGTMTGTIRVYGYKNGA